MMISIPQRSLLIGCVLFLGAGGCYRSFTAEVEEIALEDAGVVEPIPEEEKDYVLQVSSEELDEFVETQRLFFYWYNLDIDYYEILYLPVGDLGDRGGAFRDDPKSQNYLCIQSDPSIYPYGAGTAVELAIDEEGNRLPVDLTAYRGVGFYGVRNSGGEFLDLCVWDINTDPEGGRCGEDYDCLEHWCLEVPTVLGWGFYMVLFEDLERQGAPNPAAPDQFDQTAALVVSIQTKIEEKGDFCIDEIFLMQ